MTEPGVPSAGWYPDPSGVAGVRFWNGQEWTEQRVAAQPATRYQVPLDSGWQVLGKAVRVVLRLLAVVSVLQIVVFLWGLSMFEDAFTTQDYDRLDQYDNLDFATSAVAFVLLLVAGATWMIWQYQLAKSANPDELRRGPGWHAWSWIVPVVGLWFPYQNVKDLQQRRYPQRGTGVLLTWWLLFVTTNLLDRVYVAQMDEADSLDEFRSLVVLDLVSVSISLVALVLAIRIHRSLSDAELPGITGATSSAG